MPLSRAPIPADILLPGDQVPLPRPGRHAVGQAYRHAWVAAIALSTACGDGQSGTAGTDSATWFTEAEHRFNGAPEQDVLLSQIVGVRADPYRDRVFVLDAQDATASAWTPDGSLEFVVGGQGEGPGEFRLPTRLGFVDGAGVYVRESFGSGFTYYGPDGALAGTVPGVPSSVRYRDHLLRVEAPTGAGGYFAVPQITSRHFVAQGIESYPLLLVRRTDGGEWRAPEPVFRLDNRNWWHPVDLGEDRTAWMGQMFGDADMVSFGPGRAVVGRRTGGAGVVELIALDAEGDTAWLRRLEFEPQRLTHEMVREQGDHLVASVAIPGISPIRLRQAWEEGLYKPEHLPAAKSILLTASDEVWLTTYERWDTLAVHYAVRWGDMTGRPRRVLLPESMTLHDATETHVWGIRRDSLDVPHVVGRRLVRGT